MYHSVVGTRKVLTIAWFKLTMIHSCILLKSLATMVNSSTRFSLLPDPLETKYKNYQNKALDSLSGKKWKNSSVRSEKQFLFLLM